MASAVLDMLSRTSRTSEGDECYTPPEALLPILPHLNRTLSWFEPTAGKSQSIVDCLNNEGISCTGSTGQDFLTTSFDRSRFGGIITNPPYSIKDNFISKCYALKIPFALLLPLTALGGIKRGAMYRDNNLELLILDKRIDFTGKGQPHFGVAWFCWGILPQKIIFAEVPKQPIQGVV